MYSLSHRLSHHQIRQEEDKPGECNQDSQAYEITYEAPGSPELASRIVDLVKKRSIPARIDPQRGFDHGLFIPLKLMYPAAEGSIMSVFAVAGVFGLTTISTMLVMVILFNKLLKPSIMGKVERYSHALAGLIILLCGIAIVFLGL